MTKRCLVLLGTASRYLDGTLTNFKATVSNEVVGYDSVEVAAMASTFRIIVTALGCAVYSWLPTSAGELGRASYGLVALRHSGDAASTQLPGLPSLPYKVRRRADCIHAGLKLDPTTDSEA